MTGISDNETKAVLELRYRMSGDPIVFDVGSNKGGWADILIQNVKEMHLFEPNDRLLIYTMVKYDNLTNVHYINKAVTEKANETIDFYYFTNENNGLSAIYDNPKWDYLPKQKKKVQTVSLDYYWKSTQEIDFLKIDVEGMEMGVLKGAEGLLKKKQIRYIQVEYSEHYEFLAIRFADLIFWMEDFGYHCYSFEGTFKQVKAVDFKEDYHLENYYFMTEYTQDWNSEFRKNTQGIKVETALEIGCFEGLTTNYICDNLLKEGGRVVCVDPLTDEYLPGHKDNEMFKGQYERFIRNTKGRPVELIRKKSEDAYNQLKDLRFGLIYVDGDHTEAGVFYDAVHYWNLLLEGVKNVRKGGYMLFDDYGQSEETARGIDRFLDSQKGNFDLLVKDYQVLIQRLW